MKAVKHLLTYVVMLCMILAASLPAYADEIPDLNKKGSLSFTMTYKDKPVPNGTLTLYQVADLKEQNGNYVHVYTEPFAACKDSLSDLNAEKLVVNLVSYIKQKQLKGTTINIDQNGKASLKDLSVGLYLIIQETPAKGFAPVSPFLITIPLHQDGKLVYDVDATPKMGTLAQDTPKPTPTPTVTPTAPPPPVPQTGQLWWPVPVLALAGIFMMIIGWVKRREE